jgi:multidrug efflux pump subunit AcrA (membrane-fusion protein)
LREPQLRVVEAKLAAAEAARDRAKLDADRTSIVAPFNAVVLERNVNRGAYVTTATPFATIAGTDAYWVEVAVPVDALRWIEVPSTKSEVGSTVHLRDEAAWGPDENRVGRVLRLAGDLEREGRMARLIVEVDDPLCLLPPFRASPGPVPRMLIGAYISAEILGRQVEGVTALQREWMHGEHVHVITADDTLEIRKVTIAFRGANRIFVSGGLKDGDRVVTSRIAGPVEGMPLRLAATPGTATPGTMAPGTGR